MVYTYMYICNIFTPQVKEMYKCDIALVWIETYVHTYVLLYKYILAYIYLYFYICYVCSCVRFMLKNKLIDAKLLFINELDCFIICTTL